MIGAFAWDTTAPAGTLNLIKASGETVECALILRSEWEATAGLLQIIITAVKCGEVA